MSPSVEVTIPSSGRGKMDAKLKASVKRNTTVDGSSHISVLFQAYGSVWPKVLPFCIANAVISAVIFYLQNEKGVPLAVIPTGHSFMMIMVSFLVISRAQIIYGRYMGSMGHLTGIMKASRDMIQLGCVFTMHDKSEGAKMWRRELAYEITIFLKVMMVALERNNADKKAWELDGIDSSVRDSLEQLLPVDNCNGQTENLGRKWAHGKRTVEDEAFSATYATGIDLTSTIFKPRYRGPDTPQKRMQAPEELKLLACVTQMLNNYSALEATLITPYPFPLVQMARTFLFFWVFTLPFCLVSQFQHWVQLMVCIFFITYGFIGAEYVSMEMDDPFGDDPNDFDGWAMIGLAFEDIFNTIYTIDGEESANEIEKKTM
eukprot:CAMPEP_0172493456 /NCGR_PEP_ID=MMETSP1066-20121228/24920_1 /TAXON_ID=671091 /ORGANISM="Coscinodiscus wailesii, Strain CCMP2513" /LENGTH=373 /DNA_ID=CAMNT_0013263649 /DNA_START=107 /DNA_END=1231 /DNA_ORIENTATION=-